MSIDRVVCATDFSELSIRAAHVAARLAARHRAALVVLYVDPPAEMSGLGPSFKDIVAEDLSKIRRTQDRFVEAQLRKLVSDLRPRYEIEVESAFVRARAAEGIVEHVVAIDADLLVLGHHGAGAVRLILGSVAARVAQSTTVPTLVVPAAAPAECDPGARTLVAVELDPALAIPVGRGAIEVAGRGSQVEIFHALYEPAFWSIGAAAGIDTEVTRLLEMVRDGAAANLERVAAELVTPGVEIRQTLEPGAPARAILDRAAASGADLIAVGTHRRHGMARIFGTTAERVLRHAPVPVLLVPVTEVD